MRGTLYKFLCVSKVRVSCKAFLWDHHLFPGTSIVQMSDIVTLHKFHLANKSDFFLSSKYYYPCPPPPPRGGRSIFLQIPHSSDSLGFNLCHDSIPQFYPQKFCPSQHPLQNQTSICPAKYSLMWRGHHPISLAEPPADPPSLFCRRPVRDPDENLEQTLAVIRIGQPRNTIDLYHLNSKGE